MARLFEETRTESKEGRNRSTYSKVFHTSEKLSTNEIRPQLISKKNVGKYVNGSVLVCTRRKMHKRRRFFLVVDGIVSDMCMLFLLTIDFIGKLFLASNQRSTRGPPMQGLLLNACGTSFEGAILGSDFGG